MGRCVSCMWGSLRCNPVFVRYTAVYPSTVSLQFPSLSAAVSVFAQPTQCSLRWPVHWAGCCFFFVFFHVNHSSFYYSHISQEIISDMYPPFHSICTFHAVFMWRTAVPEHLNPSLLPRLPNPFLPLTFFLDLFHYYVIYRSEKYQHVLRWCKKKNAKNPAVSYVLVLHLLSGRLFFTHFCQPTCAPMCHCLLCNYQQPLRCQSPLWSNYHI